MTNTRKKIVRNGRYISNTILKILLAILLSLLLLSIFKILLDCRYIRIHTTIVDDTGYLPDNEDWDNIPDTIPPYDDDDLEAFEGEAGNRWNVD